MKKILIAPSLLSADFGRLREEVHDIEGAGADVLHVDVMDGVFVPNLTIGPLVVSAVKKIATIPLDVHLMITEPSRYIAEFRKAGADWITIHVESEKNITSTLRQIRELGAKAGISLKPKTSVLEIKPYFEFLDLILVMSVEPGFGGQSFMKEQMQKLAELRSEFSGLISVDGGIDSVTAASAVSAGADVLVAGSAIFGKPDRAKAIQDIRETIQKTL